MQSFFSTNLKFLRERKAQSQEKLSTELNITRSVLSAYEKGQVKNPTMETMLNITDYFKISLDILIKIDLRKVDEIKMKEMESRKDSDLSGKELRVIVTTVNINNKQNIEHVSLKAKAGYLAGYGDIDYISKLPVFSLPNLQKDKKYRSFPSEGDSMYPFPENAIIVGEYVDDWFSIKENEPCIIVTKEEGIVFKLVSNRISANRCFILKSLNLHYQPYEINVNEIFEIWRYRCYIYDKVPPNANATLEGILAAVSDVGGDIKKLLNISGSKSVS